MRQHQLTDNFRSQKPATENSEPVGRYAKELQAFYLQSHFRGAASHLFATSRQLHERSRALKERALEWT